MRKKDRNKEKPELTEREIARRARIREFIRYLIIGTTTTLINWGTAALLEELLDISGGINSVISWIVSVMLFAFWGYKLFVFRSRTMEKKYVLYEFIGFISARLLTLAFEWAFMWVFNDLLGFDEVIRVGFTRVVDGAETGSFALNVKEFYICKFVATVFVTILNYLFSKVIVFNGKNPLQKRLGRKMAEGGEDEPEDKDRFG